MKTDSNSFSKQSSATLQASTPTITSKNSVNPALVDQRNNVANTGIGNGERLLENLSRVFEAAQSMEDCKEDEINLGFPKTPDMTRSYESWILSPRKSNVTCRDRNDETAVQSVVETDLLMSSSPDSSICST